MESSLKVIGAAGLICIAMFILLVFGANNDRDKHDRLIQECMNDGKKRYECEAMFQSRGSNTQIVPMPIYIPSGR